PMGSVLEGKLRFCIYKGGTFTDVYAEFLGQPEEVIEVDERIDLASEPDESNLVTGISGQKVRIVKTIDEASLRPLLNGLLEKAISIGFKHVLLSSSLTPMVQAVRRCLTASVDAYTTPVIKEYLSGFISKFDDNLGNINVLFMQFDGGLAPKNRFLGPKAMLSGSVGGVIEYSQTLFRVKTEKPLIRFDMGGTSTDVSRYTGTYEQVLETQIAGAII
nr:5-oxoprolinase [Tanacetum cinerariifolium]